MNATLKTTAKKMLSAVGLQDRAQLLWTARNAPGRRNIRDDRQLKFLIRATLTPTSNCIDIGAAQGEILREMVLVAPQGQHMAFEPIPEASELLREQFPTVEIHGIALSNEVGDLEYHVAEIPPLSGLQQRDWLDTRYETITVPVARLDELVPAGKGIDLIKIDVEGAQVRVLQGATRVLAEHHPLLWIEHGDRSAATHGTTRRDLWDLLVDNDYRLFTADGDGPLSWDEFDSADIKRLWTFLAHC
ncbi:MAG: FkbM family methyltransferase [Solirubrobacteraceae bacterium]